MIFRIIVAMFSVIFGVLMMHSIFEFEKGENEELQRINASHPVVMFIGEILSVVLALGAPLWSIIGVIKHL